MKRFFAYVAISAAILWAALALSFWVRRLTCTPLLDEKCIAKYWDEVGNVLLLNWVSDKGAFFVGLLALIAAGASAILLHDQIKQNERHEAKRRHNKFNAIISLLSIHLNILSNYIDHNISVIQSFIDNDGQEMIIGSKIIINIMDIPSSTVEYLSSFIEFSDQDSRIISVLIGLIQIQDARMRKYKTVCEPENVHESYLN